MSTRPPPAPTFADDGSYYDLGSYHREVTTSNKEAQTWFDRGLIWSYAFNHEESAACFQQAIDLDPDLAMAHWGLAYALGPNYNKPWEFFEGREMESTVERSYRAVKQALKLCTAATPVEAALIEALKHRYPQEHDISKDCKDTGHSDTWNKAYADAMRGVYEAYPDDLDVTTLFVDSLMNLSPWKLWDIRTGEPAPGAFTLKAKGALESAFTQAGADSHPGLLHLWIHLMEMSSQPEAALPLANNLRRLVPDGGHLNHMPSHLDVLCGHYKDAVDANSAAIHADDKFLARAGAMNFYTLYRSHDYHFRIYAAMFSAQSKVALETVKQLEASIPAELLRVDAPPMANWLEAFVAIRAHVYVRFGKWDDLLALPLPEDQALYCTTTAIYLYAKGVALAALGRVAEAEQERARFEAARARVPRSRTLFNNTVVDILGIASEMLAGEVEYRRGNVEPAFAHLREAIRRDDGLAYDEPWGWMQPTRHALSALLLEQGRAADAAAIYRADLGEDDSLPRTFQHRNNVWSLHGYHECLLRLGREEQAREIERRLRAALEVADVPVRSSCFCRLKL